MTEQLAQWINLGMSAAALLLFIAGGAVALLRLYRERKGAQEEELARYDAAAETLQTLLRGSVYGLVTDAENEYGAGMGEIKKSAVLGKLLQLLPEQWRERFCLDELGAIIESGLARAKEIWDGT